MTIDEQLMLYLTPSQRLQLAHELEINDMLPKKIKGKTTDDHWKDPTAIKRQAIEDAKYIAARKLHNKQMEAIANTKRAFDYWEQGMTDREKLQKALSTMLQQFIDEVKNQPLITVNFKNANSVAERRNQLTIIRQTMDTIKGLKELLASMELEAGDDKEKPMSPDNLLMMDKAREMLKQRNIKSDL